MHRPPPAGSENATTESQTHLRTRLMGFVAANFGQIKAAAEEFASRAGDRRASSSAVLAQHASRMRDFFRRVSEDDRRARAEDWELQDLKFQGESEAEDEGERGDRTARARPRVSQDTEDGRSQSPTGSLIFEQPSSQ